MQPPPPPKRQRRWAARRKARLSILHALLLCAGLARPWSPTRSAGIGMIPSCAQHLRAGVCCIDAGIGPVPFACHIACPLPPYFTPITLQHHGQQSVRTRRDEIWWICLTVMLVLVFPRSSEDATTCRTRNTRLSRLRCLTFKRRALTGRPPVSLR